MSSAEAQHNKPARRGTFEKMLAVEQRSKLNRMQASSHSASQIPQSHQSHTSMAGPRRDSMTDLERRPRTLQHIPRAMTTQTLSLSIPTSQQVNGPTKYIISSQGEVIPQHEEKEEDSDASSICQSPGWGDISGKKRKKEKKEREEEKKRTEKKRSMAESAKPQKALRNRLSKAPAVMDRTLSAPAASVVPAVTKAAVPVAVAQKSERTRRGSMELGLRSLLQAKKAISTPWRSSAAPVVTPAEEIPSVPTPSSGFIGGLKLRQSMDANTQEDMRRLRMAIEQDEHLSNSERNTEAKLTQTSSRTSFTESTAPVSIYEESRTSLQLDSMSTQAALMVSTSDEVVVGDDTPMTDRNIRKGRKSHPPTSRYFENEASKSRRDLSKSSSRVSFPSDGQISTVSSPSSIPIDHPEDSRLNSSSSYSHSRQQSQEQLVSDAESNYAVGGASQAEESESRGRSEGRPGTGERGGRNGAINPILREDPASQLHARQTVGTASKKHRSSSLATSGVKSFRNAARAAFFKTSIPNHSGSDTYSSAELLTAKPLRPQLGKRVATIDIATLKTSPPTKAERILGEQLPRELSPQLPSSKHISSHRDLGPSGSSSSSSQMHCAHSRSSSDEYSNPDEYSNITSPTGSRPQSQKGCSSKTEDSVSRSQMNMSTGNIHPPKSAYLMSGAISSDENLHSGREDWSRSALPMEMSMETTDEEGGGTPTPKTQAVPHLDELDREASLSRSISNPELQDLSFLPKLKHQALAPRPPEKSNNRKPRTTNMDSKISQSAGSLSEPLELPDPLSSLPLASFPSSNKSKARSEHGSPTSPLSSQYLKNARLSLPRKPGGQAGAPEPLAKMIVVCCSCKYFHDMPSKIYACMAQPDNVVRDVARGVQGVVSTAVKCPWCGHGMSTKCCEGYAAVVYLRERLH